MHSCTNLLQWQVRPSAAQGLGSPQGKLCLFFLEAAAPGRHMGCNNSKHTIMGAQMG